MRASLYRDKRGYTRCGCCRGVRVCIYRNAAKPDSDAKRKRRIFEYLRRQGEARLKRRLRARLKKLRAENEARQPEKYDLDITPSCNGFEAALDAVSELLNERRNP